MIRKTQNGKLEALRKETQRVKGGGKKSGSGKTSIFLKANLSTEKGGTRLQKDLQHDNRIKVHPSNGRGGVVLSKDITETHDRRRGKKIYASPVREDR